MGLGTSHGCWHGAYSGFGRWRLAVAVAAGYEVAEYVDNGFHHTSPRVVMEQDWPAERYQGEWDRLPEDPLLVLLVHSDCDGIITPEAAKWLAPRLEQLLPLVGDDPDPGYTAWIREKTAQFAAGLRLAVAQGEAVDFH